MTDARSDCRYDIITSARPAKIAKHQLRNKAEEVVTNATGYEYAITPAINNLNVVPIQKICIAVQCIFYILLTKD